jgi:CRP/FNR family transcriptional regulator, cyclic AMP receptor protein
MKVVGLFRNSQEIREVAAGTVIFREGDHRDNMYGVVEGTVELLAGDEVIGTVGPDEVFGEMALIDRAPRTATAIAVTDCTLASIDERRFLLLVHETPTFALQVMSSLAEKLRRRG